MMMIPQFGTGRHRRGVRGIAMTSLSSDTGRRRRPHTRDVLEFAMRRVPLLDTGRLRLLRIRDVYLLVMRRILSLTSEHCLQPDTRSGLGLAMMRRSHGTR